jgi:hypothetical protein
MLRLLDITTSAEYVRTPRRPLAEAATIHRSHNRFSSRSCDAFPRNPIYALPCRTARESRSLQLRYKTTSAGHEQRARLSCIQCRAVYHVNTSASYGLQIFRTFLRHQSSSFDAQLTANSSCAPPRPELTATSHLDAN